MADFGAFQIETPQEVLARINSQVNKDLQSPNRTVRDTAAFSAALRAIFGDPRVEKAKNETEAVTVAAQGVRDRFQTRRDEGEQVSQLDEEIATLRAQRDALLDSGNATAAAQATQALTTLGIQREEQNILKSREARAQAITEEQLETQQRSNARAIAAGQVFHFENNPGDPNTDWTTLNTDNPEDLRVFQQKLREGQLPITNEQRFQLTKGQRNKIAQSEIGKIERRDISRRADSVRNVLRTSNTLLGILNENPEGLTLGSKAAKRLDSALFDFRDASRLLAGRNGFSGHNARIEKEFFERNIVSSRVQGLVTGLAFAIARANDPGGRLSDQDFDRALQIVGANGQANPGALAKVLQDNIRNNVLGVKDQIEALPPEAKSQFSTALRQITDAEGQFNTLTDSVLRQSLQLQGLPPDTAQTPSQQQQQSETGPETITISIPGLGEF